MPRYPGLRADGQVVIAAEPAAVIDSQRHSPAGCIKSGQIVAPEIYGKKGRNPASAGRARMIRAPIAEARRT